MLGNVENPYRATSVRSQRTADGSDERQMLHAGPNCLEVEAPGDKVRDALHLRITQETHTHTQCFVVVVAQGKIIRFIRANNDQAREKSQSTQRYQVFIMAATAAVS